MAKKAISVARRRKPVYDRRAVRDAITSVDPVIIEKVQALEDRFYAMPPVPVCVSTRRPTSTWFRNTPLIALRISFPLSCTASDKNGCRILHML